MMKRLTAAALLTALAAPALAAPPHWDGVWRNQANTVHIKAAPCGAAMCGTVIWASDKAKADAARGGTGDLVGKRLFDGFTPSGDGWQGQVFVPDLNVSFAGTITMPDKDTLVGTGCLFNGVACRSVTWVRVK
jgi:uncharacterized protein (DUF2147 family)